MKNIAPVSTAPLLAASVPEASALAPALVPASGIRFAPPLDVSESPLLPTGSIVFLVALMVLALLAVAVSRARGGMAWRRVLSSVGGQAVGASSSGNVTIEHLDTRRLDATTHLHAVRWAGRHYLIASTTHTAPQLLATDRPDHEPRV